MSTEMTLSHSGTGFLMTGRQITHHCLRGEFRVLTIYDLVASAQTTRATGADRPLTKLGLQDRL